MTGGASPGIRGKLVHPPPPPKVGISAPDTTAGAIPTGPQDCPHDKPHELPHALTQDPTGRCRCQSP
jgi:hypothetical protein